MTMKYSIDELINRKEDQTFDRKSARKDPKGLSNHFSAFANADGGTLVIGIEDNGAITGIDDYPENINEILRVPFDFCRPSVRVETEVVECMDQNGRPNHLLIITIPQSTELHANQQDDVYYRMGDKSQKLSFDDRLRLMYSKGTRYYEDEPVADSSIDDIDMDAVAAYCQKIGYTKSAQEYITQNKSFIVTKGGHSEMSGAAILLFGKDPQRFFQRARIRFIRYEGTEAKVGAQMNVIKDKVFTGRILDMLEDTLSFVQSQIKEYTHLDHDGKFVTIPEYPEFVWKELIVNAVAHRDYSIKGTDIQIKMFDDRIAVESPGNLPGIVRLNNMRQVHFSRNPKIAAYLHEYDYVQEFGEGVDRIYRELEAVGLPAPEYHDVAFMLHATVRNGAEADDGANDVANGKNVANNVANDENAANDVANSNGDIPAVEELTEKELCIYQIIRGNPEVSISKIAEEMHVTTRTIQRYISMLTEKGFITKTGTRRQVKWIVLK